MMGLCVLVKYICILLKDYILLKDQIWYIWLRYWVQHLKTNKKYNPLGMQCSWVVQNTSLKQISFPVGGSMRCSGRRSAHGMMGRQIDSPWWTHWAICHSSQCSITGVRKVMVCAILSGIVHIKEPLLLIWLSLWSFTVSWGRLPPQVIVT